MPSSFPVDRLRPQPTGAPRNSDFEPAIDW